jgi:hypothetical protein
MRMRAPVIVVVEPTVERLVVSPIRAEIDGNRMHKSTLLRLCFRNLSFSPDDTIPARFNPLNH